MKFTNTITIDRPLSEVFAFLAHLENLPLWNYAISDTEKISPGAVGAGSRYRQTRTVPARGKETFEVTEFERDHRLSIRGSLGPFHSEVTYLLTPAENGTVLTNTIKLQPSGPMRLVAPLAAPGVKSAVAANLGVLKQLLEERRPADHG
ncbi:SRPBCC family protein [Actinoplanes sp. CA-142083]|uniref:SRPBCC family protein n=1 Tax=Actinoplanes sp. CA-142083 TaxID=3239903 RepID=UPI003D940DF5